jgi:hypothetical protein
MNSEGDSKMKTYVLYTLAGLTLVSPFLFGQTNATPQPPIPEEARKHFVMGETMFKEAKNVDAFTQAVAEFTEAARLAPQWPDARYDLALAKEAAGNYSGAMADLKLYLQFKLSDAEARTAQDKIYAIEAKQKMAVDAANNPAVKQEKFMRSLEGGVWKGNTLNLPSIQERRALEIHNGLLIRKVLVWRGGQGEPDSSQVAETEHVELTGKRATYASKDLDSNCGPVTDEISDSGDAITESHSCYGREFTETFVRSR